MKYTEHLSIQNSNSNRHEIKIYQAQIRPHFTARTLMSDIEEPIQKFMISEVTKKKKTSSDFTLGNDDTTEDFKTIEQI